MAKLPSPKAVPWLVVLDGVMVARDHWHNLTPAERARLQHLLVASRGRRGNLTSREQAELKKLAAKLDVKGLGRDLLPLATKRRRGRRR